jgi:hypothetical protein
MVTRCMWAAAGVAALAGAWAIGPAALAAPAGEILRIAVVEQPSSPAGVSAGIRFGAEEVAHTARLLGREVQVVPSADAGDADARIETSSNAVSISASPHGDAGGAPCRLHLRPTGAERRAAFERWRDTAPSAPHDAALVEWHPTLVKYGAAQLNERFSRATAAPMDADAWAGWIAVKALGEAMLRATSSDLCGTLRRQALDGHKGQPLRFDEASGRLRQPLYIATPATVLDEVAAP